MPRQPANNSSRGRPSKSSRGASKSSGTASTSRLSKRPAQQSNVDDNDVDPFADSQQEQDQMDVEEEVVEDEDDQEAQKTIPPELLTRLLHEFFEKDGTRISKDANKAVAKYMDVFVREAIARAAVEKERGFLEVEDLEKVAPQLLLDL